MISSANRATVTASGAKPRMPKATTKPPKTFSRVWPAIMLANNRRLSVMGRAR